MDGVWDEDYEDDLIDFYGEAEEVPEPGTKRAKLIDPNDPDQPDKPKKVARVVQNPRPKLDVERLLSEERGLPELLKMASNLFLEPENEIDNLKQIINMMQLWSHRLFPKYTFEDFLTKCEGLGKKRPVKTHLRKVRTGQIDI